MSRKPKPPTPDPPVRCNPVYGSCYLASGHEGVHHGYPLTQADAEVNSLVATVTPTLAARLSDDVLLRAMVAFQNQPRHGSHAEQEAAAYAAMRAVLVAALTPEPAPTWQPMSTAPKDRDIIVLTDSIVGLPSIVCQCRWHPDAGFCVDELRHPQWWMEMPPAPATDTREREK